MYSSAAAQLYPYRCIAAARGVKILYALVKSSPISCERQKLCWWEKLCSSLSSTPSPSCSSDSGPSTWGNTDRLHYK